MKLNILYVGGRKPDRKKKKIKNITNDHETVMTKIIFRVKLGASSLDGRCKQENFRVR